MTHVGSKLRLPLVLCEAAGLLLLAACAAGGVTPVSYRVTPGSADTQVTYQVTGGDLVAEIHCPSGIGSAQFVRTGGAPEALVLRLHLRGLEGLTFEYPGATVKVFVSSQDGAVGESVSVAGGAETPLEPGSPYWMDVKIEAADKSIPLHDGAFIVLAPTAFLTAERQDFTVRWVDFYR